MDRETRNRIQRATQGARALLEREYAEQLAGTFDVRLDGTVAAAPGGHLDAGQRVVRGKLVTAVEHLRAGGHGKDAVAAYVREAAFTTLNRFVALKMLEARGLVQECLSRGEESSGFKEFVGLAPGLVQLPDHGFQLYIESLFDEIGREVRVLFDRRDPASLLWPRRQPLLDLLAILNAAELASVWGEDETAGWVYQYFNSDEERRQMRAESQAPRNSRELAVRNQFFTPRYVVQFLTDNTLGRIWYEMRRGETKLRELDYLVRRPNEVFLGEGEAPPAGSDGSDEDVSQDEVLRRPVHVPFRAKKDPRDIRVLDPACGSGHFLLYAFDLLLAIYEEAWADEASPQSEVIGNTLREDYADLAALRAAAPGLILRHNLHGIDIDARCAQIAALALWMRAQRAFMDLGFERDARPLIQKTNIVVAEPMPGEPELRREFIATLDAKLGQLVGQVFKRMELAGEAGSLLRIEDDIREAIREIYGEYGRLFRASDEERWRQVEQEVLRELRGYGERAANGHAFQRRLFAEDAARGLGLIDLCGQRYDVVLMNPPFGEPTHAIVSLWRDELGNRKANDLYAAFVLRALQLVEGREGYVGAITSRAGFFMGSFHTWRTAIRSAARVEALADLGYGVLDALVEVCCYVLSRRGSDAGVFASLLSEQDKAASLQLAVDKFVRGTRLEYVFVRRRSDFDSLPAGELSYWLPAPVLRAFRGQSVATSKLGIVRQGLQTGDDFRFLRAAWEVPREAIGKRWRWLAKGGEYSPYYDDVHLLVDWRTDGHALKAFENEKTGLPHGNIWMLGATASQFFFRGGWTYTKRTTSGFTLKALPRGVIFSDQAMSLFPGGAESRERASVAAGWLLSRVGQLFVEAQIGLGDAVVSGSAARRYTQAVVESVPLPDLSRSDADGLATRAERLAVLAAELFRHEETSRWFAGPAVIPQAGQSFGDAMEKYLRSREDVILEILQVTLELDKLAQGAFGSTLLAECDSTICPHPLSYQDRDLSAEEQELLALPIDRLVAAARDRRGSARAITKKVFFGDRRLEVLAHAIAVSPVALVRLRRRDAIAPADTLREAASEYLQFLVGAAFGRWSGYAGLERAQIDPWRELPGAGPLDLSIPTSDVLIDDPGHPRDIAACIAAAVNEWWGEALAFQAEVEATLGGSIRSWLRQSGFDEHRRKYSKSRRSAPTYWQLATPSASYSVWLYYHRFTRDTLYRVLNDYVTPKLKHEERKLASLSQDAGPNPSASQRKEIDEQEQFVAELRAMRDEVARVAPLWNPDLNDGVIINFAPLWRLVPQNRSWQKECKAVWDQLVAGEYDWAHLAMHLWPERVVPNCGKDRSFAIAHGLEEVFWEEDAEGKWRPKKVANEVVDRLVEERTSPAVKGALDDLLRAPAPAGTAGERRGAGRRRSVADGARPTASRSRGSATPVDDATIAAVRDAIAAADGGASKGEVMEATGISSSGWNAAINALLAQSAVIKTGAARGTRYQLATRGGTA